MNKRVLSMLSAGVMAASTLLSSVPAFAAGTSGYVLMNVPYGEFYKAQGVTIDAVSKATQKANNPGLMGGATDTDKETGVTSETKMSGAYGDGSNILGVTIPVYVSDLSTLPATKAVSATDTKTVSYSGRGQTTEIELTGKQTLLTAGDYAYYILGEDETPAVYANYTDGKVSALVGASSATNAEAVIKDGVNSNHTEYTVEGDAFNLEQSDATIYGAVLTATTGEKYPLVAVDQIWRNYEYGFDTEDFAGITDKTLNSIIIYTGEGTTTYNFEENLKVKPIHNETVTAEAEDKNTVTLDTLPEDIKGAVATVYYQVGTGRNAKTYNIAEGVQIVDGVISLDVDLEEDKTYYVKITSDNYSAMRSEGCNLAKTPVTPSEDEEEQEESKARHTHDYEWVVTKKATATTDGLMKYRCKKCGSVEYEVPMSAYYVFNKETQEAVKSAAAGATVKVETPIFISFHEMVKEALTERSDVTLVVDYKNAGKSYEMTIPAGSSAVLEQLYGQSQYAGFLYLGGAFATVER